MTTFHVQLTHHSPAPAGASAGAAQFVHSWRRPFPRPTQVLINISNPALLTQTNAVLLQKNRLPGCGSVVSAVEIPTHLFFFF